MYCTGCDYQLEGLTTRTCPECRKRFDPADSGTFMPFPGCGWRKRQFGWFALVLILLALEVVHAVRTYADSTLFLLVVTGSIGCLSMLTGILLRRSRPDLRISMLMTMPALAVVALITSLAIHMYMSLGGWPKTIGTGGFSRSLEIHADLAMFGFTILLLSNLLAWAMLLGFGCTRRSQQWIYHLGIFTMSSCICIGLLPFAPDQFVSWWWD